MNGYQIATKFITRIVLGSILAIFLGLKLDDYFHVRPLFTIGFLLYVMIGSLVLLVKEISNGRET
ncbi:MAG: hypothetical protein ACI4U3_06095 [Traorella sp.]